MGAFLSPQWNQRSERKGWSAGTLSSLIRRNRKSVKGNVKGTNHYESDSRIGDGIHFLSFPWHPTAQESS